MLKNIIDSIQFDFVFDPSVIGSDDGSDSTWEKIVKKNPKIKKRIICDEAWMLVSKNMPAGIMPITIVEVPSIASLRSASLTNMLLKIEAIAIGTIIVLITLMISFSER